MRIARETRESTERIIERRSSGKGTVQHRGGGDKKRRRVTKDESKGLES
jgi:hypothetical protein